MLDFIFGIAFHRNLFCYSQPKFVCFWCLGTLRCHGNRHFVPRSEQLTSHIGRTPCKSFYRKSFRVILEWTSPLVLIKCILLPFNLRMFLFCYDWTKITENRFWSFNWLKKLEISWTNTRKRQFPISLDGNWSLLLTLALIDTINFIFNHLERCQLSLTTLNCVPYSCNNPIHATR